MAAEGKLEETQLEQNIAPKQEDEKEPSKNVDDGLNMAESEKEVVVMVVAGDKANEGEEVETATKSPNGIEKTSSFKEESNLLSDLKEHEKKALSALRSKIDEAILGNKLFNDKKEKEKQVSPRNEGEEKEKSMEKEEGDDKKEESLANEGKGEEKEDVKQEGEAKENTEKVAEKSSIEIEEKGVEVDKDIAIWGVPLLPSKGDKGTDVILLKFLRAREFKVNDAFEMLRNTLQWRKQNNIDSILDEEFEADLGSAAYMDGNDRKGHPVCYNIFGVLGNDELYSKTLGNEEKREKFLRWRIQLMEKGIQKLDFKPSGVSTMLQINDLKNTPLPTKKDVRNATRKAVELLQENYPEFVAKNIFINVPFWYYAFSAVLSPFFTQRTKNKFIYARASKVTDTLLKYIAAEEIPVQYGGLKRENDSDFSINDIAKEATVKAGSTETVEIPAPEAGNTLIWDLIVCGWEVNYKEEFVPTDEGSYTIIVQKGRKITWQESSSLRNSFKNNEPGKIVITIENGSFKKKRILYRYKTKSLSSSSSSS